MGNRGSTPNIVHESGGGASRSSIGQGTDWWKRGELESAPEREREGQTQRVKGGIYVCYARVYRRCSSSQWKSKVPPMDLDYDLHSDVSCPGGGHLKSLISDQSKNFSWKRKKKKEEMNHVAR